MMTEPLELQLARAHVQRYEGDCQDAILHASRQAQDCLDCEEYLEKGIQSLKWLERAEEVLQAADAEGLTEFTPALEESLATLHELWMRPCDSVKKWISRCEGMGFQVRNLAAFNEACERAQEWLERHALYTLGRAALEERFAEDSP